MNKKGFSLFELILTCSIIAFLAAYALPSLGFFSRSLIDEQVELLHQLFLYLQLKSSASQKQYALTFDCNAQTYSYTLDNEKEKKIMLPAGIRFGTHSKTFGPPSKPEHLINEPSTFPKLNTMIYQVIFFPTMTMSSGSLYLYCEHHLQTRALTVAIDSLALVRKYTLEGKEWKKYE